MSDVVISQVIHPDTGEVLAFEIVDNIGQVFWASCSPKWSGLRAGGFPRVNSGDAYVECEIVEIARLSTQDGTP